MKQLFLALVFILPLLLGAQKLDAKINWVTIEEAVELNKEEPRKIFIDVYTSWCGPCKMMMKNTFTNTDLIEYVNENYYAVKFNAESPDPLVFNGETYENPDYDPARRGRNGVHQFARFMQIQAYPTIMYLDEDLNFLMPDKGYKTPQQMEILLKFFGQDTHKVVVTQEQWNEYQTEFKPEFVETTKQ